MQAVPVLIDTYPNLLPVITGLLGLLVGSFLNVVIHRLPIMMEREWQRFTQEEKAEGDDKAPTLEAAFNLAVPGSHCPQCNHKLAAWENIPILSYLMLKRRCRQCQTRISARYPLVELTSALLAVLVAEEFGFTASLLGLLLFTWALLSASLIDFDHKLIPDDISLPLLWLGLLLTAVDIGVPGVTLYDSVLGAAIGYLSLWSLYWAFLLLTGKHGLGYGDFKLLAALGAWLGWQSLLPVLLLASLGGSFVGIVLIVTQGRSRSSAIPFGPFLAGAGFIMLVWGPRLTQTYANLLGV